MHQVDWSSEIKVNHWYDYKEEWILIKEITSMATGIVKVYNKTGGYSDQRSLRLDFLRGYAPIKQPLCTMTPEEYKTLLESGMFYEWYPEATGAYSRDTGKRGEDWRTEGVEQDMIEMSGSAKLTGGSSPNQYRKSLLLPLSEDRTKYVEVDLEVEDITEAWKINPNTFNCIKAYLRLGVKQGTTVEYDLDKILWFTLKEKQERGIITKAQLWEYRKALGLCEEV